MTQTTINPKAISITAFRAGRRFGRAIRYHVEYLVSPDPEELERMFVLAYQRRPDDEDRANGLWSLVCAA